jgi:hypothetical protein
MAKYEKVIQKILQGRADANIDFEDLRSPLKHFGFEERISGSHHIFRPAGVEEHLNPQCDGAKAKPYQVRQVRKIILEYRLGIDDDT